MRETLKRERGERVTFEVIGRANYHTEFTELLPSLWLSFFFLHFLLLFCMSHAAFSHAICVCCSEKSMFACWCAAAAAGRGREGRERKESRKWTAPCVCHFLPSFFLIALSHLSLFFALLCCNCHSAPCRATRRDKGAAKGDARKQSNSNTQRAQHTE